ncbi:MAG: ABC transporter ATP-binding protein [Actinobacteria bacterium]|nr:ABC transporter ATP-binding protein [Actinomycetota bacterium]
MTSPEETPLLEVRELSISFGGLQALNQVSFAVEEGEIFGLIGPNGAGKTTLFNCVSGLIQATSGVIHYEGQPLDGLPIHARSLVGIARTFQNLNLFHGLTVLENLMVPVEVRQRRGFIADAFRATRSRFGESQAREEAGAILHLLHLGDLRDVMAGELPVGLQRRVELGRAVAQRPRLLLLDEPASGLDGRETAELGALLPRIARQLSVTIVLVDHDMALVMRVCDRICALDFGQVIAMGTPAEVRNDPTVMSAYLGASGAVQVAQR